MDSARVTELMDTFTYKPGYEIECLVDSDSVFVSVTFDVENSSYGFSEWDQRPEVIAHQEFKVELTPDMSDDEFKFMVLAGMLVTVEAHESREFARWGGEATFHPHTSEGEYLYDMFTS